MSRKHVSREPVEVEIDGISSEGAGVGRLPDGRAVFVHRTAPGDRVRLECTQETERWARGRLIEVLTPGPGRREAPCPLYARCGGCTLQHLDMSAQLQAKGGIVREALRRIGHQTELPPLRVTPSPRKLHYRNRMTFTLRRSSATKVTAGLHVLEDPSRLLEVDGRCLLPEPSIVQTWNALRDAWGKDARSLPAGEELRLTLRSTRDGRVLLIVAGGRGRGDPDRLLEAVPGLEAIWQAPASAEDPHLLLGGAARLEEHWLGQPMDLQPDAFLQVNREAARSLHSAVVRRMGSLAGRRVVDAYCGIGTYGRHAARNGAHAVGIEVSQGAHRVAEGAPQPGFEMIPGRVETHISNVLPADIVVLNPPRAGVAPEVLEALNASAVPRIIYASCDPATLARDVRRLTVDVGPALRVTGVEVFDLFPQTAHVETVLTLERSESGATDSTAPSSRSPRDR